jgi:tRNA-uridine 2-sulfurtransferase
VPVLAALSGGVDSAVAAARMLAAGHDVVGVHLALSRTPAATRTGSRGCCSREDARDARRVADVLGIPFYVWDVSERFQAEVVDDFVAEYGAGRTPNPCLRCNETIKFAAVLDRALALGFDGVCTGHYARREVAADGSVTLHRAVDAAKDQSYVLAVLTQYQLRHALFPLGWDHKDAVRAEAAARGLAVATKPDSHDICFIPDGDTAGYLHRTLGDAPGPIVDARTGAVVGHHNGVHAFTVGQRRGLALAEPAADGRPRYVLSLSPVSRTVTVGPREDLAVAGAWTAAPVWSSGRTGGPGGTGDPGETGGATAGLAVLAQYRAHGEAVPAAVQAVAATGPEGRRLRPPDDAALAVSFGTAQLGVAPGQALAFYGGDGGTQVLGSATIVGTWRS